MKKLLSLIIATAMVISLLPCAFAAEGELELAYNFDFGAAGYGSPAEIDATTLESYGDLLTPSQDSKDSHTWANTNGNAWLVDGHRRGTDIVLTGSDVGSSTTKKADSVFFSMAGTRVWKKDSSGKGVKVTDGALAIRLQIDKAGTYVPTLTYYPREDLAIYDVYLVSLKTEGFYLQASDRNRLTFENSGITGTIYTTITGSSNLFLGSVDMYGTGTEAKSIELNAYTVAEDEADYTQFALILYPNGLNPVLQTKYAKSNGPTQYLNIDSFKLYTEKKEEETLDSEFTYTEETHTGGSTTLRAFAVYGTDGEVSETEIIETPDVAYGNTCTVSTPENVTKEEKSYNFLYWAKGATMERKQIISYNADFEYRPSEGANYLIAVYEEVNAEAGENTYYNANGERLENGDTLPSMAGFGTAKGWVSAGNGIFVAEYDDPAKDIEITVNGEKENYAYGETVTCTATAPEGKVFMYWTKNGEVVTTDATYTFNAWKDCSVEAVFGDVAPTLGKTMRKIILDSFIAGTENAVMAEFIGFSDALEKGIMFGNKRVAMTTDKTQFSVIDDVDGEICGYAIIKDGGELKIITDGELSE